MKFFKIFYYNYYLFYLKILKVPDPKITTILALSFSQSLLINGAMDIVALNFFCYEIKVAVQFSILLLIIFLNYFLYHEKGKAYDIIKENPTIGTSKTLSIFVTIVFFLMTTSWLFWGPIYGKYLLSQCK